MWPLALLTAVHFLKPSNWILCHCLGIILLKSLVKLFFFLSILSNDDGSKSSLKTQWSESLSLKIWSYNYEDFHSYKAQALSYQTVQWKSWIFRWSDLPLGGTGRCLHSFFIVTPSQRRLSNLFHALLFQTISQAQFSKPIGIKRGEKREIRVL